MIWVKVAGDDRFTSKVIAQVEKPIILIKNYDKTNKSDFNGRYYWHDRLFLCRAGLGSAATGARNPINEI